MRLTIRVYKRYDTDLLALKCSDYPFIPVIKETLREYIAGKNPHNEIPSQLCNPVSSLPVSSAFHIYLSEKNDKDIIEWISHITKGRRNAVVKNIFRNSFDPIINPYISTSENEKYYLN